MDDQLAGVYQAYYLPLVRLAKQLVDDVESAEETVQDVFVRVHRRAGAEPPTYAYLRTAVVNQSRSMLRRRRVMRRTPDLAVAAPPDGVASGIADRDQIRRAIVGLSRRQREVVVMRYYEDLSLQEIAATLHISVNATSAALSRALQSISTYVGSDK